MRRLILPLLFALPAHADPAFIDRSGALPAPHVYEGGWTHFVGGGVAILDCNGDSRPDLFAAGGAAPASLLVNDTAPGSDITFRAGPVQETGVIGAYPLDVDGDGQMDLFVLRDGVNRLLRGDGDCGFTDATARMGLPEDARWTTAFSATWEDGADRPTLAIGNYVDRDDPDGPFGTCDESYLLRPEGDRYGAPIPLAPSFCPLSMLISDWRREGDPLLRVSNDRHYYLSEGYEQMWDLSPLREWGAAEGWDTMRLWGMGIASGDITGDGRPEVVLTSMGDQMIMENTGGGFTAFPFAIGAYAQRPHTGDDGRPSTGWHAEFGDVDNDGRLDLFIAKGNVDQMPGLAMEDPNNLLMQGADGTFVEAAADAGVATVARSRGGGLADLNGDGRLDLVVVNRRAPLEIWQNATPDSGRWLSVKLTQPGPNRNAVGAWIDLRGAAGPQSREVTVGGGHAGGQAGPVHFGLGDADMAELRITWPDGTVGDWQPVAADTAITLRRE
ncbi:Repeat domain-containing protein [Palleronia salina]|uniref:Repeat domain-containing protein n=1 Tax=Palleronia salina TaxID=313368 RepID=A0A1M6HSP3_9RHOB|nr:CRTAC1 family protein [Palleronia salina]SHJ25215.1 Repeat domain-containing protein [Palleronia salina]